MRKLRQKSVQDEKTVSDYRKEYRISETAARVLYNRVGDDRSAADLFLSAVPFEYYDPFLLSDMDRAAARLKKAIENRERVVVYGDYDVDGITSVSLMLKYLTSKGLTPDYYIPDRAGEGYGMNIAALRKLRSEGASLVITVDNGISAFDEITEGEAAGLDFIITDHHESDGRVPEATAVINPKISPDYPFRELAGVGVAFKLICAVEGKGSEKKILSEYGEIIAVGTIADVVPLLSENREIAKVGLRKMNRGDVCPGLAALIGLLNKNGREITSSTIGYMLAPRINAAGRMGTTEKAVGLFMAATPEEAVFYAEALCEENRVRQETEQRIMEEAEEALEKQVDLSKDKVMVISGHGWHQGVIGIIASRLTDRYYLPSVLISEENGAAKGSGRSIAGFNLFEAFSACSEYLDKFGGHELAAGLSLDAANIDVFRKAINEYAEKKMTDDVMLARITAECELGFGDVDLTLCREMSRFEPCGTANPQPIFLIKGLRVLSVAPLSSRRFSRFLLSDGRNELSAVCFDIPYDSLICGAGDRINVMATVSENVFRDKASAQLTIKDIELTSGNPAAPELDIVSEKDAPSVEELRQIFLYFKARALERCEILGLNPLAEHICSDRGVQISKTKALLAVMIFNELGIIKTKNRDLGLVIASTNFNGKVDLNDSEIYRILKSKKEEKANG